MELKLDKFDKKIKKIEIKSEKLHSKLQISYYNYMQKEENRARERKKPFLRYKK